MKHVVDHPQRPLNGRRYWRSLEDLEDSPEFHVWLDREFPEGAAELAGDEVSRRNFLRLMGASLALAGFGSAGCRRPESYIVPFTDGVEWIIPGRALLYATAMPFPTGAVPLIVTTHEGRPTKIEGNPLVPGSAGGTNAQSQASVLDLYDLDRSARILQKGAVSDQAAFEASLGETAERLLRQNGEGLAVVVSRKDSPTRERLLGELQKRYPQMVVCVYEPVDLDQRDQAWSAAFPTGARPTPDFAQADCILSLDCDFLGTEPGALTANRDFAARRRVSSPEALAQKPMNRLYAVENAYTITGGMADHRLRCATSQLGAFAVAVASKISELTGNSLLAAVVAAVRKVTGEGSFDQAWIQPVAEDLVLQKGKSLVLAGSRQPWFVQVLALAMNDALGAYGSTLRVAQPPETAAGVPAPLTLAELTAHMAAGKVTDLFLLEADPAPTAPADMAWREQLGKVPNVVRLAYYEGSDAGSYAWNLPLAHYLESWGDVRLDDGTYCVVQPMILPLLGGLSELDILSRLLALPASDGAPLVKETFEKLFAPADVEGAWTLCLRDGFRAGSEHPVRPLRPSIDLALLGSTEPARSAGGFEVVFSVCQKIHDGRFGNNGWLQELPDPTTKVTWGNAALMSPATAKALGVRDGDMIDISVGDRTVALPAVQAPGHAEQSVTVALGYGGTDPNRRVMNGVGWDVQPLRASSGAYYVTGATVVRGKGRHELAQTQLHNSMEGRDHFREGTVSAFSEDATFAQTMGMDGHIPPNVSIYHTPKLDAPNQWGMTFDLNACTGCNACIIACQAENNIPIVGAEQVIHGREMHWIRLDRYYASGDDDILDPEMVMQPIPCMQCENAPCETVCPVNATVHNTEGLNVMAYNRCIGTRYCANNCPYKVRRFNFFDYNKRSISRVPLTVGPLKVGETSNLYLGPLGAKNSVELLKMQKNPNVTVRMRGVMEKCTFCVQRIEEAKINHKIKHRGTDDVVVPGDSFKTACQQACPAQAISFGNMSDPAATVNAMKAQPRNFSLINYLNTRPRVTYLARIKNPNMHVPGAERVASFNSAGHHGHGTGEDAHHDESAVPAGESAVPGGEAGKAGEAH